MAWKRRLGNAIAAGLALGLRLGGEKTYRFFLDALWERFPYSDGGPSRLDISVYSPPHVDPDPCDRPLVERIFDSYRRAKRDQARAGAAYQPSSMWRNIFRMAYGSVTESLEDGDIDRFHAFLANFGSWSEPTAIEESQLIRQCATDLQRRGHLEQKIMAPLVRWWLRFESRGRSLAALEIPRHGNFGGLRVDGHLLSPGSIFSDIYARLLAGTLPSERPLVGELGGGFGRLLYFLLQYKPSLRYVGFDLPETLCCAAYYLMKAFPKKRFLLYGEEEWSESHLHQYDILLLPSFAITDLPARSVDLFINENSLGGVEASACKNYVREICRSANAFWHRNHEWTRFEFDDGTTSLINAEYPVPEDEFELVVRYADVGPLVRVDRLDHDTDMFWYYYRRRTTT